MILVDTSVWVEFFAHPSRLDLASEIDLDDVVTCLPVIQEILQGFDDQRAYLMAREAMFAFPIVESPLGSAVFEDAVDLYRRARRAGFTVRSGVDCLVAACAMRNSLAIVHRDRDYDALGEIAGLEVRRL